MSFVFLPDLIFCFKFESQYYMFLISVAPKFISKERISLEKPQKFGYIVDPNPRIAKFRP